VRVKEKKKVETKTTIFITLYSFSYDKQIQLCAEKKYAMLKKEEGK